MKLYLIRHTSVQLNGEQTCYGFTDVDVNESFEQEARLTKEKLEGLSFDAVFSSPLTRAKKLAEYCAYPNIIYDERLKELNFGDWEGQAWTDIIQGEDVIQFFKKHITIPAPNGESQAMQQERIEQFLLEKEAMGYQQIAIFCHGGVINAIKSLVGICSLEEAFAQIPPFGSVTQIEFSKNNKKGIEA